MIEYRKSRSKPFRRIHDFICRAEAICLTWDEARTMYPDKWLLFEAIEAYSKDSKRIVKDISIINVFESGKEALKQYAEKYKLNKNREMYVYHTNNKDLDITERYWIGVRRYG
jgi:hypothetical protein